MFEILDQPAPEAIERFLTSWYGPRTVESALPEPGRSTLMPAPLRRFYDLIRRWPDAIVQNVVLAPPELPDLRKEAWAETYIDDGSSPSTSRTKACADGRRRAKRSTRRPSGYAARRPTLARVVEPLHRLPFGAWRWPSYPTEFYAGDRVLAVAGPNPGPDEPVATAEYVSLSLGAIDGDALEYLDDISQPTWQWFSRRDGPATV